MIETEVLIKPDADLSKADETVENLCKSEGLQMTMKDTLLKYPGCIHWHFKKDSQRGTIEITLWEKTHRIWFSVQSGRTGDWIKETVKKLKIALEKSIV